MPDARLLCKPRPMHGVVATETDNLPGLRLRHHKQDGWHDRSATVGAVYDRPSFL